MSTTDTGLRPILVGLARDHDPAVLSIPGMTIGPAELREPAADAVARWRCEGVRRVDLPDAVDLTVTGDDATAADTVRRLVLVRELTSHGIAVDWRLRLPGVEADEWLPYSHLRTPVELLPAPGAWVTRPGSSTPGSGVSTSTSAPTVGGRGSSRCGTAVPAG